MDVIRGQRGRPPDPRGCAATIGNFDGVHRGHQAVLAELRALAAADGLPTAVICFEPTPQERFQGARAPARLTTLREKAALLAAAGVDRLICLRFDAALAGLEAEAFVGEVLARALGVRRAVVGDDFRFGRGRGGDFELLSHVGANHGLRVERMGALIEGGERASSTRVRAALAAADLDGAARLLGRRYGFMGRVAHGDKLGARLGFPTANLRLARRVAPLTGVFLVAVRGPGGWRRFGAASIGTRPAVGGTELRCETHLIDFAGDLYGACIEVELVAKLRDEWPFDSLDALRVQIARDVEQAREMVRSMGNV
jgi:riboflavin kinase/FMN adenylyltransferase